MCYCLYPGDLPLVAKRNILVSKSTSFTPNENNFTSKYQTYYYVKGRVNPVVTLKVERNHPTYPKINEGYHSYRDASGKSGLFFIPKGSIYYASKQTGHEYVSSQLVYLGKNSWFKRMKFRLTGKV